MCVESLIDVNISINFCEDEFNLSSVAISALMPTKLAVDVLYHKEANLLTADVLS
jgi:hypothetical protein